MATGVYEARASPLAQERPPLRAAARHEPLFFSLVRNNTFWHSADFLYLEQSIDVDRSWDEDLRVGPLPAVPAAGQARVLRRVQALRARREEVLSFQHSYPLAQRLISFIFLWLRFCATGRSPYLSSFLFACAVGNYGKAVMVVSGINDLLITMLTLVDPAPLLQERAREGRANAVGLVRGLGRVLRPEPSDQGDVVQHPRVHARVSLFLPRGDQETRLQPDLHHRRRDRGGRSHREARFAARHIGEGGLRHLRPAGRAQLRELSRPHGLPHPRIEPRHRLRVRPSVRVQARHRDPGRSRFSASSRTASLVFFSPIGRSASSSRGRTSR